MIARAVRVSSVLALLPSLALVAQPPDGPGPGGPPVPREIALKARFDADGNGVLDAEERARARGEAKERPRRGPRGRGGPGAAEPPAGAPRAPMRVAPGDVESFPDAALYDPDVVRTIFLEFAQADWFEECADFYRTDVDVPATMRVDGQEYRDVGVSFRGNSSYFGVPGRKKSFGIALDAVHRDQRLYGHRTLNLLNAHADPSFLREAVHALVARRYTAAAQANIVHLVVNGESYGAYVNVQQVNKDFLEQEFGTKKGTRWKVPANFRGDGLGYRGDERGPYESTYQLKGTDGEEGAAWQRLIALCRTLNQTPLDRLPEELPKVLDVDAALRFLAVDAVLLDGDGYASRGSDFMLWEGPDGRFRPLPYDSNEILGGGGGMRRGRRGGPPGEPPERAGRGDERGGPPERAGPPFPPGPGGPGGRGGPMRAPSPTASPLALLESGRPLARLLEVPAWKARYLALVRAMATEGLDWAGLGPFVERLHQRIDPLVRADDKALYGYQAFAPSVEALRRMVDTRRKALLEHEALQGDWPAVVDVACTLVGDGEQARVQVRASVRGAARVVLWASAGRSQAFVPLPMLDDGAHDDGEPDDGVYGAVTAPFPRKGRVYVWVEASTDDACVVTMSPPAGSGRPWVVALAPK